MELALIIAIVALIVALPGCIADSITIIAKIRAHNEQRRSLKKGSCSGTTRRWLPLKKSSLGIPDTKKIDLTRPTPALQKNLDARPLQALCLVLSYFDITHPDHIGPRAFLKTLVR
jgi:hypothetical protein